MADGMKWLSVDDILHANDILTEEVAVPEWGGKVLVQGLTGEERDRFEKSIMTGKGKNRDVDLANARAKLVALSVVHPDTKKPLFTLSQAEILGQKSASALSRVYNVAAKLSGLSDDDVEQLVGNSKAAQNGGSGSN